MTPTLIVLALVVLAVGIVAWATRRKPSQPQVTQADQDTAWNDPVTPATSGRASTTTTTDVPPAADRPVDRPLDRPLP